MLKKIFNKLKKIINQGYVKKEVDGLTFYLKPEYGGLSQELLVADRRELGFMYLLSHNINQDDICFDLGANIGYTTLYMLQKIKNGFVYAIEPDPRNLELLEKNIKANNFVEKSEVTAGVISNKDGKIDFYMASRPNISSLTEHGKSTDKIKVESYRFTTFFAKRKFPNFIKMDVEGAEVEILADALDYFEKNKGKTKILFECHQYYYNKNNLTDEFKKILSEYLKIGFQIKYIISTPVANPKFLKEKGYQPIKIFDFGHCQRGLYDSIKTKDALSAICDYHYEGDSHRIVRATMLVRE